MVNKAKLGPAFRKLPKAGRAVVSRRGGSALTKQPKPFTRGVASERMPSSMDLFNVGNVSEIPGGTLPETGRSTREGTRLLKGSRKRRSKVG